MSILSLVTSPAGVVGVVPAVIYINTDDSIATVLTAGFLNSYAASHPGVLNNNEMALVSTTDGVAWLEVAITGTTYSLVEAVNPGSIVLPTIANHIAIFTNTTGTLSEDAATAINGGNIQAGLSGTAGYLASFPSAALKGSLHLTAVANTGDTLTTISNAAMGQASVISIPDPSAATANFILSSFTGTQLISLGSLQVSGGNLTAGISGTAGYLRSFAPTAARGSLYLAAANNAGDTATVITNAAMGQVSTITIPDPGASTANFILSALAAAGTQHITSGSLQVDAGNLTAGSSGAAGTLSSFSSTAARGRLIIAAVANTGNTNTTISNVAMGQASVISIPDPVAATANFVVAPAALVSNNLIKASGTAGLVADAGFKIIANVTAAYGGGGTSNAFTATGLSSTSIVTAVIATSTNAVAIAKAVPSANTLTVTFTADPGAATTVYYIATTAAV